MQTGTLYCLYAFETLLGISVFYARYHQNKSTKESAERIHEGERLSKTELERRITVEPTKMKNCPSSGRRGSQTEIVAEDLESSGRLARSRTDSEVRVANHESKLREVGLLYAEEDQERSSSSSSDRSANSGNQLGTD